MKQIPFFLSQEYLQRQEDLVLLEEKGVFISISGTEYGQSPGRAPFGGFFFPDENGKDIFGSLLLKLENHAISTGMRSLEIQMPPGIYWNHPQKPWFEEKMRSFGFAEVFTEINYHLNLEEDFRKNLRPSERWKLRKAEKMGFRFGDVLQPDWNLVYNFLLESRRRRGYQLSMSRQELKDCFDTFPERYRLWEVRSPKDETAALGVSVNVCSETEYLFYTADSISFRNISPVVMLHDGITARLQESRKKFLDLGTASLKGEINKGVADFKTAIGGIRGEKIRWKKTWANKA